MLPKIGIRPVIDGRWGGVRESLEVQTMNMAEAAAKLIKDTLRYPSGEPVQVIIADGTIGGAVEAARCEDKFQSENVCATLSVTPCWCYSGETMDMNPVTVKAVWGFNGTERPGAVYLAAVLAAHAQKGLPAFSIYGRDVQDIGDTDIPEDVAEKILRFVRAGLVVGLMRNKCYVNIGAVSMGIAGSYCDDNFFRKYLGIRADWVGMPEILRRIELGIFDNEEFEHAMKWVKANCKEDTDRNKMPFDRAKQDANWEFCVKMTLICRDIMIGNPRLGEMGHFEEALGRNAIAAGFQGQRMWTDHWPNGDFMESILCSSFDWNGKRRPFVMATENDTLNATAMIFLHNLTGRAAVFADVRTYWSPEAVKRVTGHTPEGKASNGFIHLINSGAAALDGTGAMTENGVRLMKRWWDVNEADIEACLKSVKWGPANQEYMRGGGFSSTYSTIGEMPVTMLRVNIIDGLGPTMQIAEGWTVDLPAQVNHTLLERTDPTWPSTWFAPRLTGKGAYTDVYNVMANWGANHGAFVYGHVGADIITLASMLRIPVAMSNVSDIYRPHVWAGFGTNDPEGADYRACASFGPLYK